MKNVASRNPTGCITWILVKINVAFGDSPRDRRWRDHLCFGQCFRNCRWRAQYWYVSADHNGHEHVYDPTKLHSRSNLEVVDLRLFRPPFFPKPRMCICRLFALLVDSFPRNGKNGLFRSQVRYF